MPILVVEDDDAIRESLVELLEFAGYQVMAAAHGAEALALVTTTTPSLVVTDMWMPVMDGWQLVPALRARGITAPVLVVTAAREPERAAAEAGADAVLAKPFAADRLLSEIARLHRPV